MCLEIAPAQCKRRSTRALDDADQCGQRCLRYRAHHRAHTEHHIDAPVRYVVGRHDAADAAECGSGTRGDDERRDEPRQRRSRRRYNYRARGQSQPRCSSYKAPCTARPAT